MLADPDTGFWRIPRNSDDLGLLRRLLEQADQEALHLAGKQSNEVGVKMERALAPITDTTLRRIWRQATELLTDRGFEPSRVGSADWDLVYKRPVLCTPAQTIDLASGEPVDAAELLPEFHLNRAPTCVGFVRIGHEANTSGCPGYEGFHAAFGKWGPAAGGAAPSPPPVRAAQSARPHIRRG